MIPRATPCPTRRRSGSTGGFTVIELVIVICVVGILAGIAVPQVQRVLDSSRVQATENEMDTIIRAIVGSGPADGGAGIPGYEQDVGKPPQQLTDLLSRPASVPPLNRFTGLGWNGPYLDATPEELTTDAFGLAYHYDPKKRLLQSNNPVKPITKRF